MEMTMRRSAPGATNPVRKAMATAVRQNRGPLRPMRTGSGTYGDGDPHTYTDSNGVDWVIVDNDCGALDLFSCSTTDIQNRYWATQRVARYAFDPVPSLRHQTLDGVKVLVDKFAEGHSPTVSLPGGASGDDDIAPGDGVSDNGDGTITVTKKKPGGGTVSVTRPKPPSMKTASRLDAWDYLSLAAPPAVGWWIFGWPWGAVGGAAFSTAVYAFTDK